MYETVAILRAMTRAVQDFVEWLIYTILREWRQEACRTQVNLLNFIAAWKEQEHRPLWPCMALFNVNSHMSIPHDNWPCKKASYFAKHAAWYFSRIALNCNGAISRTTGGISFLMTLLMNENNAVMQVEIFLLRLLFRNDANDWDLRIKLHVPTA